LHRKLRAAVGLRHTAVRFADRTNTLWFRDTTYNASLRFDATSWLGLHGVASRGFRAPNLNDLGALGLNDLGYEIPASEAIPAGALLATSAGENALSKNARLRALQAESLMNYEFGVTLRNRKLESRLQGFHADLTDPIVRRTLLFPANSAPTSLAGLPVTVIPPTADQRNQGVATLAAQGRQSRLSGGDIDDERIGASRRRQDIASFFNSTMASQFIDPVSLTFRPTNETLLQIQNRVLPGVADGVRVPLYLSTKPWATLSFRSGYALTDRWRLMGALENLLDQNYRQHGSDIDSPGFNTYLNLSYRF
jgi:outer membrane receptor protein involved in Fe transport